MLYPIVSHRATRLRYNAGITVSTLRIGAASHSIVFYRGIFVRRLALDHADIDFVHAAVVGSYETGLANNEHPERIEWRIRSILGSHA